MVTTRSKATAGSNTKSSQATVEAPAWTAQATPTHTATTQAGPGATPKKKGRRNPPRRGFPKAYPRKESNKRYREVPPDGDYAAELRRKFKKSWKNARCDRCRVLGLPCTRDINGCRSCKRAEARCTVTDLRNEVTYVKGVATTPQAQILNQVFEKQIKDLTEQVTDLKSHLKYDTEAQALSDLRQENERLRAENKQYRSMSMSMSTTAGAAAAFQTEENRLTRPSPMLGDAPFATQQLDLGGNPYTPATRAGDTNNRTGATTNPVTLPTWAQPAPAGYFADPGYMPGGVNAFSGPAAGPVQGSKDHGYPGLAVDPTLLPDPTASADGQEYITQPFLDYVYNDEQANNQADANDFNRFDIGGYPAPPEPNGGDIVDDDALFDDILWDQ
ncbi:hypothetical protein BJY00DRAFT_313492 [Aspergillus carlsbadensis]|nr:hypothetical protein BJY00DRAFT_313492 [Aspergillus carlsbadensis]